jgi:hypothetical protein
MVGGPGCSRVRLPDQSILMEPTRLFQPLRIEGS